MSLLAKLILSAVLATAAAQCPTNFFQSDDGICYMALDQQGLNLTWLEGRVMCQDLSDSTWSVDLAVFDNAEMLSNLSKAWMEFGKPSLPEDPYMWIGVLKVNGEWVMLNGSPIPLQNNMWREGHPHDMAEFAFLDDVVVSSGIYSHGRMYIHCSMGIYEHHSRALCRADPV